MSKTLLFLYACYKISYAFSFTSASFDFENLAEIMKPVILLTKTKKILKDFVGWDKTTYSEVEKDTTRN